ncbi:hypothetical protein [Zestomonas carbonaria]|uniref:O-antigen ligase like membrane protein n=1 Tax=Zestomonas carbonaria TaxID=2762745 RepID=A0A7U7ERH6_9GAMM|nr:hypothetical protein [Pseudomonas carbonaria]CAD5109711.1 hypothetical protein PSEWESI4_04017 [Pseudomonas carbonaria]
MLSEKSWVSGFGAFFVYFLIFLIFYHQYIFVNLEEALGVEIFLKAWKELLVFILLPVVFYAFSLRGWPRDRAASTFILMLFWLFSVFASSRGSLFEDFLSFKAFSTPLLLASVLYFINLYSLNMHRHYVNAFCLVSLLFSFYACYQYLAFTVPEDFWYYNIFIARGHEQNFWEFFRGDRPRLSSFFTSSLEFALTLTFCYAIFFSMFMGTVGVRRLLWGGVVSFLLLVITISSVRSALVLIIVGHMCVFFFSYVRPVMRKFWMFAFVAFLVLATFWAIKTGVIADLSSAGRLRQWEEFFSLVAASPLGEGASSVGVGRLYWFDSFYINLFLSIGLILGVVYLLFMFSPAFYLISLYKGEAYRRASLHTRALSYGVVFYTPGLLYSFVFQSFFNAVAIYIYTMVSFSVCFYFKKNGASDK